MSSRRRAWQSAAAAVLLFAVTTGLAVAQQQRITVQDVLSGDPVPPDHRIAYGDHPLQFGDLRIPGGEGPWPVAILIHGGCWQSIATAQYFDRVAEAITDMGVVTWNIEYRPVDVEGGGWPGTFLDVAHGIDKLRDIEAEYGLGMERVIALGHSAGGHLALWAAGRPRIEEDSDLYIEDPLPIGGVVSLAGIPELRRYRDIDPPTCGEGIVDRLMGGGPREVPERYIAGSPFQMLPLNVAQIHITGRNDDIVPPRQVSAYNYESQSAGDDSTLIVVPDAGHYEVVWPGTPAWEQVEEAVRGLLGL
ncbi:MAG: alpha/beta hydrolase [Acidobacteriota bacterium]|jgi:acetyl esterase/lipase